MGGKLKVEKVEHNDSRWTYLLQNSPQATPFVYPEHLSAVGYYTVNYLAEHKGQAMAGLALPVRCFDDQPNGAVPYASYQGLLFTDNLMPPNHKNYRARLELTEALIEAAGRQYSSMAFRNHWTIEDIRGIDWYHYHEPEKGRFTFSIFYTAIKDISYPDAIWENVNSARKQDYKKAVRMSLKCEISEDIGDFRYLYNLTFARQGINLDENALDMVKNIIQAGVNHQYGRLFYARDKDNKAVSAVFILYDRNNVYYMFGANDPEYRTWGAGTYLLIEAMNWAHQAGKGKFDFLGINSPLRGDFKLTLGPQLKPYYYAHINCNII